MTNLFRERGSARGWPLILGAAAKELGVCPTPPPKPDLQIPAACLDVLARALDFASSPHKGRHQLSAAPGADDAAIYDQVLTGVRGPEWLHWDSAGATGINFAQRFHRVGGCR